MGPDMNLEITPGILLVQTFMVRDEPHWDL